MGPDIWGLQNRGKGPKYFSKKGYFGDKTGPQKPDVKEFFNVEEHFNSKKWWDDLAIKPFPKEICAMPEVHLTKLRLKCLLTVRKTGWQDSVMEKLARCAENFTK